MKLGYIYGGKIKGDIILGTDPYSGVPATFTGQGRIMLGSIAAPRAQVVAAEKGIECVIGANALGGDINGALLGVVATINLTATLVGIRPRVTINTGVTLTGEAEAIRVSIYALGTAVITGSFEGMRIAMQNAGTVTQTGDVRGIYINNVMAVAPVTYEMIRLEENGAALCLSMISGYFNVGDISYFAIFSNNRTAWNWEGDKTPGAVHGWLRVAVNDVERFIQLYGP